MTDGKDKTKLRTLKRTQKMRSGDKPSAKAALDALEAEFKSTGDPTHWALGAEEPPTTAGEDTGPHGGVAGIAQVHHGPDGQLEPGGGPIDPRRVTTARGVGVGEPVRRVVGEPIEAQHIDLPDEARDSTLPTDRPEPLSRDTLPSVRGPESAEELALRNKTTEPDCVSERTPADQLSTPPRGLPAADNERQSTEDLASTPAPIGDAYAPGSLPEQQPAPPTPPMGGMYAPGSLPSDNSEPLSADPLAFGHGAEQPPPSSPWAVTDSEPPVSRENQPSSIAPTSDVPVVEPAAESSGVTPRVVLSIAAGVFVLLCGSVVLVLSGDSAESKSNAGASASAASEPKHAASHASVPQPYPTVMMDPPPLESSADTHDSPDIAPLPTTPQQTATATSNWPPATLSRTPGAPASANVLTPPPDPTVVPEPTSKGPTPIFERED